ncbi:MAG: hypothetical protein R6V06_05720 [Kiritimatiellia bacterium]
MKKIAELISYLSLVLIVLASFLYYGGKVSLAQNKTLMLIATVIWFVSALCWMGRDEKVPD